MFHRYFPLKNTLTTVQEENFNIQYTFLALYIMVRITARIIVFEIMVLLLSVNVFNQSIYFNYVTRTYYVIYF
jgi:hypothetical protein